MKATMRLYKQHDLDLISLYKNPEFSLEDVLITSLRAYLKQEPVCFYVPTLFPMDLEVTPRIVMLHINLDDDKDADIIDFIEKIREKYRNSFFKNIIRGSIVNCNFYPYMTDKENIKKSSLYIKSNLKDVNEKITLLSPPKKRKGKKSREILLAEEEQTNFEWITVPMRNATSENIKVTDTNVIVYSNNRKNEILKRVNKTESLIKSDEIIIKNNNGNKKNNIKEELEEIEEIKEKTEEKLVISDKTNYDIFKETKEETQDDKESMIVKTSDNKNDSSSSVSILDSFDKMMNTL